MSVKLPNPYGFSSSHVSHFASDWEWALSCERAILEFRRNLEHQIPAAYCATTYGGGNDLDSRQARCIGYWSGSIFFVRELMYDYFNGHLPK